jgi:ribonuclease D
MPDAIWIDRTDKLPALAAALDKQPTIGVDTEFLRERTFFPKLCVLQISAAGQIWCIDALRRDSLQALVPALTATATRKVIHAARQDLEAFYLNSKRIVSPVFDTQVAAGCIGLKPQIGYAELANQLLGVTVAKGQTRTDWSKRPLSRAQLEYAAEDVLHLGEIAARLTMRLRELGRERWALEDCLALEDPALYEPDPARAWERVRGLAQLAPRPRSRAKAIAVWREKQARDRDLPRSWILADAAIFEAAQANPTTPQALRQLHSLSDEFHDACAHSLLEVLREAAQRDPDDMEPSRELRPTAEQRSLMERLATIVDARAAELGVSAEILAPRGELKALALGERNTAALQGWRRAEIGESLLASL